MNIKAVVQGQHRSGGWLRVWLVILALAGVVISSVLMYLSAPADAPPTIFGATVCAAGETINCDYVLHSRWSMVGPIPATFLGLAYFAGLVAWFAFVGLPNYAGRHWHWIPLVIVALGVCGSIGFMLVMGLTLPVWCTWCVAAHIVNFLIFICMILGRPRRAEARPAETDGQPMARALPYPSPQRVLIVLGGICSLVVMLGLVIFLVRSQMNARLLQMRYMKAVNNAEYIQWRFGLEEVREIPVRPDDFAFGAADAKHQVVVFSDYECANCFEFFRSSTKLVSLFPGELRMVFKQYPVSTTCNPHIKTVFHYFSCDAADAAEAARRVGTPKQTHQYHHLLYANAAKLDQRPYAAFAEEVGLDPERFAEALGTEEAKQRLREDMDLADSLGVHETPAIFLDGRRLPTWRISTDDVSPKLDVKATIALWESLLGTKASRKPVDAEAD